MFRSNPPEVFLGKDVLKTCSKFPGEHPCQSAISCKFAVYFPLISYLPVNLLHIFSRNTSGEPLLYVFRKASF